MRPRCILRDFGWLHAANSVWTGVLFIPNKASQTRPRSTWTVTVALQTQRLMSMSSWGRLKMRRLASGVNFDFKMKETNRGWCDCSPGSVPFTFFIYSNRKKRKDYKLDFSIAGCNEMEHPILLGVDLSRGYRRQFRVQGALRLSCPCVTSDEGGDRVVSLLEAAVSSSWSLWASCTWSTMSTSFTCQNTTWERLTRSSGQRNACPPTHSSMTMGPGLISSISMKAKHFVLVNLFLGL